MQVLTAHGFLSFQPDGRIEYRKEAGAWENIEIIGLAELLRPSPQTPSSPVPAPPNPADELNPQPNAAYVARVKNWCVARGISLAGAEGAFQITKRVAWGLRDQHYGLLDKPGGNNAFGYATDIVMHSGHGGEIVDILGDGGGKNTPLWNDPADVVNIDRWRPPVAP